MKGMRGKDVKLIIIISRRLRLRLRPGTGRGGEGEGGIPFACECMRRRRRRREEKMENERAKEGGIWGMGVRGKFSILPPLGNTIPRLTTPHSSAKAREGEGEETGGVRRREGMKLRGKNTNGVPPLANEKFKRKNLITFPRFSSRWRGNRT